MPKKTKKYRIKKAEAGKNQTEAPGRDRTPEEKREYKKLALFLAVWVVFVFSAYFAFVRYCEQNEDGFLMSVVMPVYLGLGVVFFFLWMVHNGGLKKFDAARYEKPDDMGYDEFCKILEKLKGRHRQSKYFMVVFMPFFMVFLIDYLMIKWIK